MPQNETPDQASRRVRCIHCRAILAGIESETCRCLQCGRDLRIRNHFSARFNAWMGVAEAGPQSSSYEPAAADEQTFRGAFTFRNSPTGVARFPFPFRGARFAYGVNLEPHVAGARGSVFEHAFDVDEHYLAELRERARVLRNDPLRCQVLPSLRDAQWETLNLLMRELARAYPQSFTLSRDGQRHRWINRPLGIDQPFTFGDDHSLPQPPFEYITRQMQGDFCLIAQSDDQLWLEGGMVTSPADWSLDFDLGMNFQNWHRPVPLPEGSRMFDRALKALLGVQADAPLRRLNWGVTIHPRLDTSPETYDEWHRDRAGVTAENIGALAHLRVELQTLWRLPVSNALLFPIRAFLISFEQLATVDGWAKSFAQVLRTVPPEVARYKGLARLGELAVAWLEAHAR